LSHVVFDYSDPPETLSVEARAFHDRRANLVEACGEPWVSYFDPRELHARLEKRGLSKVEDLGPREIRSRFFPECMGTLTERGGHILLATNRGREH
jgi:O-methyltransferase involved in polyketide biosynthesis